VKNSSKPASSSKLTYAAENEIVEDHSNTNDDGKMVVQQRLTHANTMSCVLEEFQLIGREKEKSDIIELIQEQASTQEFEVIALWGMGGLGKTTLIKHIYQRLQVTSMFQKFAFITVLRPFNLEELLRCLALQLEARNDAMDFVGDTQKSISLMGVTDLIEVLERRSQGKSFLIVLDDLSSTTEWDKILPSLRAMKTSSLVIVITTRREDIAKHCCKKPKCICLIDGLQENDAYNLFTKKVLKEYHSHYSLSLNSVLNFGRFHNSIF
jgi:predicted ATPase